MAEEVIEQLEIAFKQLKDEATSLIKASKNNEYKENDGRVNDDFLARYFTMRKTELRNYEQLMSELRSIQDEDARTYLEEEAAYTCILTVQALMGKLNFIINGDIPPSGTATPRREASPQRYQPAQQQGALVENDASQETLFQDGSSRERHSMNSNNNQALHPNSSASSFFKGANVPRYVWTSNQRSSPAIL